MKMSLVYVPPVTTSATGLVMPTCVPRPSPLIEGVNGAAMPCRADMGVLRRSFTVIAGYIVPRLSPAGEQAFREYLERRMRLPRFAHGRSTRNAIDRARLRHANRLVSGEQEPGRDELMTIEADDIYASSIFRANGAG